MIKVQAKLMLRELKNIKSSQVDQVIKASGVVNLGSSWDLLRDAGISLTSPGDLNQLKW